MASAQKQAKSIMPDAGAELSSSVAADESNAPSWQWLWWAAILLLLPIAGWRWKHWKASKNGATEAKERHPSYYKFLDAYKTLRSKERAVRSNTMS